MSEHFCKNCKNGESNTCKYTGATHRTGIECPSFEAKEKESKMGFKIGDKVRIVANEKRLYDIGLDKKYTGMLGIVDRYSDNGFFYRVLIDDVESTRGFTERDLELVEPEHKCIFVDHPEGVLEVKEQDNGLQELADTGKIRTFSSGATRDTANNKLDYVKALSPIVLRRYVQYLDKHRLQPDGSYRGFDNWKKGISQETYHSGGGRHFVDVWLLTEGYVTEDNHGPVDLEDAICARLFNDMGRLHEILKTKVDRTAPVEGGY